ncbi:MAG: MotA/TolQ/ExbB proton channel family protein [Veillonellaceae bacterium]|nr:MotA/TolQ/ExbB proton channel family protein [Veillonellaceae bacterium]
MEALHLFHAGGLVMYPLLLCSIISIAIGIERFGYYRKAKSDINKLVEVLPQYLEAGDIPGLQRALEEDGGFPAHVVAEALQRIHTSVSQTAIVEGAASHAASMLRSYLNYLEVIVTMSPLLGLLGTVVGMIGSFNVLSVSEGQPFAITAGVGEALVATATGLLVAIIALVIHTYLAHRLDILVSDMERLASVYLAHVEGEKYEA